MKNIVSIAFFIFIISFVHSQEVPFDQLNLTGSALYAATKIKERFPGVVFTGGTRTLDSQARSVAQNIFRSQNSGWVGATYRDSSFIRILNQEIIKNWALIKGNESLILQKVNEIFQNYNAEARSMSKHLSGYAFDLRVNCVNYNDLNNFVRTLPGFHQFLTQEGGLAVWHLEFNEAPIPPNDNTSQNSFQASHKVVTNDGTPLRLREGPGTSARQINSLPYGSFVQVLEIGTSFVDGEGNRGNWMRVRTSNGNIGWCFGAYLQTISQTTSNTQTLINFTGTWVGIDNNFTWIFNGSNYTIRKNGENSEIGTFSVNANQTKFYQNMTHTWYNGTWIECTGTLVNDLTILSNNRFRVSGFNGFYSFNETYEKR